MNQSLESIKILRGEHRLDGLFDNNPKFPNHGSMVAACYRYIRVFETLAAVVRGIVIGE